MLTVLIVVLSSFLSGTQACAALPNPDQNSTLGASKTAEITLIVAPPVEWTAPVAGQEPTLDQSQTKAAAEEKAKRILDSSIRALLADHQFAVDAVSNKMTYSAPEILVGANCADTTLNATNVVIDGNVIYTCSNNLVSADFEVIITLDMTAQAPVAQTQWENMTAKLGDKLETKRILVKSISVKLQTV